jgi:glycosyltransferase involved in cell wall biosynthesis
MEQLDRVGCDGFVLALSVKNRDIYPFPPDQKIIVAGQPSNVRRIYDRARGRPGSERFADQLESRYRPLAPDLVHAHFGWASHSGAAVAGRLGVPLVVTFHGTDATVPLGRSSGRWHRARRRGYADVFERIDAAICVSRFIEDKVRALGFAAPVEILPAGVRLERFPFRAAEPLDESFRLIQVGRLNPQKGLAVLLTALPAVVREVPNVHLDVVGQGPSREDFERLTAKLGLADRVTFHGPVPSVLPYLRAAHVLVAPSRAMPSGAAEGSPVVTKEAQAIGIPVVATDTGGMAETFPPEHRADLVPGDDPDALAAQIIALARDGPARRARARVARAWVEREFDAEVLAGRTLALYERLVERRPAGPEQEPVAGPRPGTSTDHGSTGVARRQPRLTP